jgi:predicted dehydrogenase
MAAGAKGVLMEKPVAPSIDAARRVLEMVSASHTVVAIDYIRRFPPVYRELIDRVRSGTFGRVHTVVGIYTKGVINNGSHLIDLLRALLGEPVAWQTVGSDGDVDDPTVSAVLAFSGGVEALVARADGNAFNVFDLDIVGTSGRVVLSDLGHQIAWHGVEDTAAIHGFRQLQRVVQPEPTHLDQAIRYAVADLIESVDAGRQPLCTVQDGYEALRVALDLARLTR